jgi:hypothetical protein
MTSSRSGNSQRSWPGRKRQRAWPAGHDLPGHASIVTTERYDTRRPEALMAAAKLLEPVRK